MAIRIPYKIIAGLLGWAIFAIQPVQADIPTFSRQAQQTAPHLDTSSAVLDSQHQQQKERLEDAQHQREDLQKSLLLPTQPDEDVSTTDTQCVTINEITFQGAESLSASTLNTLIQPYVHQCVTLTGLKQLVRAATNAYISSGYVTSQAQLPEQNLADGKLLIVVIEGKVGAVEIDGNPPRMAKMLFPNMVGKTLNLRDIEQGLEYLNRLTSSRFTIDNQSSQSRRYLYREAG
ncbi:ShlB/FhaC/HecB family hemolysin secretion/activation protein [Xenorhabdus sp. PB62.4]|uniref:ShlB/FhaC/HecB family hemolysin secretion/activation protein n=1 Tax=Xenorhabdus sp. PB62.4 TaxID=1851573 RepID=UPI001656D8E6|nr:ShlB/FhaC/HecB family hemolysin secretion/activation protein [Xenorhabdus sp. PB62.4]MBC8952383.1 putative hemolysin activator ShlB-type [Xenorhabdus sp. PB62.4]